MLHVTKIEADPETWHGLGVEIEVYRYEKHPEGTTVEIKRGMDVVRFTPNEARQVIAALQAALLTGPES
ncbi:hypothetical protein [Alloactinosynnema sp. L-07]|uniref:hypothetical protein n=1 Tax=Alloactinosynnema sp. L-07 TaxID=1653480 RepID=UPI00065EFA60|nr:hypothetical protein [Alloactinosynnema sp. L-07]CRK59059.1 hypothetical protein [Alloactinosynnema sp. L-07]